MTLPNSLHRQKGLALIIGMIMLVMLTLLVVSAINSGSINLRISGNMQAEDEARATAQQAIEQFVSVYANFYPTPTAAGPTGFDINNDGANEYTVSVTAPVCKRAAPQNIPRSIDCANGAKNGIFCWDTLWEVTATSVDAKSGVSQSVAQGVSITFPPDFDPTTVGC